MRAYVITTAIIFSCNAAINLIDVWNMEKTNREHRRNVVSLITASVIAVWGWVVL